MLKLNQHELHSEIASDRAEFSNLRVAFVSDAIHARNGVGTYYLDLISHLDDRVGALELIAPSGKRKDPFQSFSFSVPGDSTQRLYFPKYRALIRRLRQLDPHLIVFPTVGPFTVFCLPYARKMGIPICIGRHTDFERLADLYCHRYLAPFCRPLMRWLSSSLLRSADSIVTNDVRDLDQLEEKDRSTAHLVGTMISKLFLDTPVVAPRSNLQEVVFIGRLGPEKNISLLLESAKRLPDLTFTIGGDGPLRDQVESELKNLPNLNYLGWLDRKSVVDAIDRADMLVLPSVVESFGSVALEAMARARNVLVSRNCGIQNWPRLAEQLFYWEKEESLDEAIQRVADASSRQRVERAFAGRDAAIQINNSAIEDWLEVFRETLQRHSDGRAPAFVHHESGETQ